MSAVILIAASDPRRLVRLRKLVEAQGAAALTAEDGPDAIRQLIRREPDLVLLYVDSDIGLELCRDMKTLRRHRSVFVVAARETRQAAFDYGCDAFINRQNDSRPLEQAVRRFLSGTRRPPALGPLEISV
jgi:DNA-binding response OmpR family regulator